MDSHHRRESGGGRSWGRALLVLAGTVAALALAACGGGEGEEGEPGESSVGVLASAASSTAAAQSSRFDFHASLVVPSTDETVNFGGEGAFDYENRRGELTFDISELLGTAAAGDGAAEVVFDGSVFYLNLPLLAGFLPEGKPWLKLDLATLSGEAGVDLSQLSQLGQGDPSQALDYLRAVADVEEVGREEVRGVETIHYRGTIDLEKVPSQAPAEVREEVQASIDALVAQSGTKELPVEVWVDDEGLVRRMSFSYESEFTPPGSSEPQRGAVTITIELFDFGTAVDVEPPPADQTIDFEELVAVSEARTETGS